MGNEGYRRKTRDEMEGESNLRHASEPRNDAGEEKWWEGPAVIILLPFLPIIGVVLGVAYLVAAPFNLIAMLGEGAKETKHRSDIKKEANERIIEGELGSQQVLNYVDVGDVDVDPDEDVVLEPCEEHEDSFRVFTPDGEKLRPCERCGH